MVSGLAAGLAAASLGGVGTANATCASISGIDIGTGCASSPLSFALALGPNRVASAEGLFTGAIAIGTNNVANAEGFLIAAIAIGLDSTSTGPAPNTVADSRGAISLAYAGGNNATALTFGNLAFAAGQGDGYFTQAGGLLTDVGNVALSLGNNVEPDEPGAVDAVIAGDTGAPVTRDPSYFNLAANLGDDNNVQSQGLLNSVLNIAGNGNDVSAALGVLNNATNLFGDDNGVVAGNVPDPTANILQQIGGNVAFNAIGDDNTVQAGSLIAPPPGGPLAIVGTLGVDAQSISQPGTGITIATPFNSTDSNTNVLAAGATQRSLVRPSLNASLSRPNATSSGGSVLKSVSDRITKSANKFSSQGSLFRPSLNSTPNHPNSASPTGSVLKSVSDRITTSTKKFSDAVSRVTGGLAGGADAGAASTSSSDK